LGQNATQIPQPLHQERSMWCCFNFFLAIGLFPYSDEIKMMVHPVKTPAITVLWQVKQAQTLEKLLLRIFIITRPGL
jgi:hypothetical protein